METAIKHLFIIVLQQSSINNNSNKHENVEKKLKLAE